jgi:uncharacterized repeat protein (TIGR02543 family)
MTVLQSSRIGAVGGGVAVDLEILNIGNVPAITPAPPPTNPPLPTVVAREGLTHMGWSTVPNPPTANFLFSGTNMAINDNTTVHAVWVHRVEFRGHTGLTSGNSWRKIPEADSGRSVGTHGRSSSASSGGSASVILNAEFIGMPQNPVRPGFEFIGWTTNWPPPGGVNYFADITTAQAHVNFTGATPITSNTIVNAVWVRNPNHTVTFHTNGGTALPWTTVDVPDTGTQVALPGGIANRYRYFPYHPTREGYVFMGWYIGNAGNDGGNGGVPAYRYRTDTIVNDNLHIWAHWVPAISVNFMPNGGGGTPETVNVPQGRTWHDLARNRRSTTWSGGYGLETDQASLMPLFTEPPNHAPVANQRTTRNFFWNTEPDGTGMVFNENTVVTDQLTVYRVWHVNVTFNNM